MTATAAYQHAQPRRLRASLKRKGVKPGSVWRYFEYPGDDKHFAFVEVLDLEDGAVLRLKVWPETTGNWGNMHPKARELASLSAAGFLRLINTHNLVRA